MVQVYTDKSVTAIKANAVLAYFVYVVLLKFTNDIFRFLIDYAYIFAGLHPVDTTNDEKDSHEDKIEFQVHTEPLFLLYDNHSVSTKNNATTTKV